MKNSPNNWDPVHRKKRITFNKSTKLNRNFRNEILDPGLAVKNFFMSKKLFIVIFPGQLLICISKLGDNIT